MVVVSLHKVRKSDPEGLRLPACLFNSFECLHLAIASDLKDGDCEQHYAGSCGGNRQGYVAVRQGQVGVNTREAATDHNSDDTEQ